MSKKYHWIDDSVIIDFSVPDTLKELMTMAEEKDIEEDLGYYLNLADTIDICAKNCYASGELSKHQWNVIASKYRQ